MAQHRSINTTTNMTVMTIVFACLAVDPTCHTSTALPEPPRVQWPHHVNNINIPSSYFAAASSGRNKSPTYSGGGAGDGRKLLRTPNTDSKDLAVCSIPNLLDITRLRSRETRSIFSAAIEDVELIREYYSEAMHNGGLVGGRSDMVELAYSYDWLGRGTRPMSTVEAGLGWVDDNPERRMERYISASDNQPHVGTKQSDMRAFDSSSNLFPWLVDRRSRESEWYVSHQNGRSEGQGKEPLPAKKLYAATWTVSWGDCLPYFPPLIAYGKGSPMNFGDSVGSAYNGRNDPTPMAAFVDNPNRTVKFVNPYPDVAQPGLALISAVAPIYYTGEFDGFVYNDTYVGAAGVDIALASVSSVFGDLEDKLSQGSFAFLVDTQSFSAIAISQSVVKKIYPERTGFEENRPEDRRNQTYLVSDTIFQPLVEDGKSSLDSADWAFLHDAVLSTGIGERDFAILNITLTGEVFAEEFYVAFDRWEYVSDWTLLAFAPVEKIDNAINPIANKTLFYFPKVLTNDTVGDSVVISNEGYLEFRILAMEEKNPKWVQFVYPEQVSDYGTVLRPGESLQIPFTIAAGLLENGNSSSSLSFAILDYDYRDCFYNQALVVLVSIEVVPFPQLNQLGAVRIAGYCLATIVILLALYCVWWVHSHQKERVVRASQPLFLVTIAFGSLLMACTIIPLSIDDGVASIRGCDIACMASPWLFSVGFVTSFAALFSKLWRINKIFQSNRFQRVMVTEKDVLVPFVVLFLLNFVLLLAWTLTDPLIWDRQEVDDFNNSYGRCICHGSAHVYFLSAIVTINVAALVLACYQAFKARGISDEYSETKFIAIAVGGWVQVVLIGVPLLFLVAGNPTADFFIKSSIIFAITLAMLLLIFVPKMVHEKSRDSASSKRATQSAEVQRIMARATAYANAAASAPANLETYRVSSLSNNSQNSEIEASVVFTSYSNSTGSISDGMGFRIIGSIETDQKKLAEVQDENKILKRQLKREQRELERLKVLLAERGGTPHTVPAFQFLAPQGERLSGLTERTQKQGNGGFTRVTFFDDTKSGSVGINTTKTEQDVNGSPPTPKRRLSPDRDVLNNNAPFIPVNLDAIPAQTVADRENEDTEGDDMVVYAAESVEDPAKIMHSHSWDEH